MIKIESVFFDMDGLLFDTEQIAIELISRINWDLGFHLPFEAYVEASGHKYEDCLQISKQFAGKNYPYEKIWKKVEKEMTRLAQLGKIPLKPGAKKLLLALKERGVPSALVTSSSRATTNELLQGAHLSSLFLNTLTGESVHHGKPDPEIYQLACEQNSFDPKRTIAFEDSPSGAQAVLASGIHLALIPDFIKPNENLIKKALIFKKTLNETQEELWNYLN